MVSTENKGEQGRPTYKEDGLKVVQLLVYGIAFESEFVDFFPVDQVFH